MLENDDQQKGTNLRKKRKTRSHLTATPHYVPGVNPPGWPLISA